MAKTIQVRDDFEPFFFDEVGRLVVAAGRVKYVLKLCLKQLHGAGFTAGMLKAESIRQLTCLCDEVSTLAAVRLTGPKSAGLQALIAKIRTLAEDRHDTLHALWTTTKLREPLRVRPQIKGKKNSKSVNWSKTKVVTLGELREVRRRLEDAYASLQTQRETWP